MKLPWIRVGMLLFLTGLAACGGGGDSAEPTTPPQVANCTWDSTQWDNCLWQ